MSFLKVTDLSFRYDKRKTDGISKINFSINSGEVLGLIGPSGSGKTTTLKCIQGQIKNYDGFISLPENERISYLDLNYSLPADKDVQSFLIEQINSELFPTQEQKINQVRNILAQLEITNEINSPIASLSGGQRQRVMIALSLINNPGLLLLDEPFSNLDNLLRKQLLDELFDFFKSQELTVVWVTHNTEEALAFSNKLLLLNYGTVQQFGTPQELYSKPNNLFTAQFFTDSNTIPVKLLSLVEDTISFKFLDQTINLKRPINILENSEIDDLLLVIHPEEIKILDKGGYSAQITNSQFKGAYTSLEVQTNELFINIEVKSNETPKKHKIRFDINWENVHFLSEV